MSWNRRGIGSLDLKVMEIEERLKNLDDRIKRWEKEVEYEKRRNRKNSRGMQR
jgi:hypothetical protein